MLIRSHMSADPYPEEEQISPPWGQYISAPGITVVENLTGSLIKENADGFQMQLNFISIGMMPTFISYLHTF